MQHCCLTFIEVPSPTILERIFVSVILDALRRQGNATEGYVKRPVLGSELPCNTVVPPTRRLKLGSELPCNIAADSP